MASNLVVVESPAKAKTIEKFLGKDYKVVSSFGHIRDLPKKNLGIDVENKFLPNYEISVDKKKVVSALIKDVKKSDIVWLATDEDREGEAIAWHLHEALQLQEKEVKRIAFHEITKKAVVNAISAPRSIDYDLVNAQQARRVLDRIVGFKLSPVLWKKVQSGLSAGRVQSVAVRLIVEREKEIKSFESKDFFVLTASFLNANKQTIVSNANIEFAEFNDIEAFLKKCMNASFFVSSLVVKPSKKSSPPPFTTSSLQQTASSKLGFSVSKTMIIAQKLYESGKITYMRTDSTNLSNDSVSEIKDYIENKYGKDYSNPKKYATKSKNAQEAHEAIRPTSVNEVDLNMGKDEQRLYEIIWNRVVASQMSDALCEVTTLNIKNKKNIDSETYFLSKGEVVKFPGFLKLTNYDQESGILPNVDLNESLELLSMSGRQKFKKPKSRFNEASLVRKLEELGIGRPSTYAPTISVIQRRNYVEKKDADGFERSYLAIKFDNDKIETSNETERAGTEKRKLFPTDIGIITNDFLVDNFQEILDYNFTAQVEKDFDNIASGNLEWNDMIGQFYSKFNPEISKVLEFAEKSVGKRHLGKDPKTGKNVYVRIGRYGPMVQMGDGEEEDEKIRFAGLQKGQKMDAITLDEALGLFMFPRSVGVFEDNEVLVNLGRFGPYIKYQQGFVSIKEVDPSLISLAQCIELIKEKRIQDAQKYINVFNEEDPVIEVLNGRYGPYIKSEKKNYKIPKNTDPEKLSRADCLDLIKKSKK